MEEKERQTTARPLLVSLRQAGVLLNLSPGTIRKLVRQGKLPTVPITTTEGVRRKLMFRYSDLEAWTIQMRTYMQSWRREQGQCEEQGQRQCEEQGQRQCEEQGMPINDVPPVG